MHFIVSKLAWAVLEPANLMLIALILGVLAALLGWRRPTRFLIGLSVVLAVVFGLLPAGEWLLVPLEQHFPPPSVMPAKIDGIIVLGGGVDTRLSKLRNQPLVGDPADRFLAMVYLGHRYPNAKLVYSGGGAPFEATFKEADAARMVLDELGVDTAHVIFERQSRNTYENVVFSKAMLKPQPNETWLLVTSAWHMPRAMAVFRAQGWPVVPYPVDYTTSGTYEFDLDLNFNGRMGEAARAIKEWLGLIAYRLYGWTDSVLPSAVAP